MNNDSWAVENIIPRQKSKPTRNFIESVEVNYSPTRKTRLKLCILGSWSVQMPPYGLARLSALTKSAGYWTKNYDFNVHTYHFLKYEDPTLEDSFNPANDWWWKNHKDYYEKIFPAYESLLEEYLEYLLEDAPDIIGFSVYHTNVLSTLWMAQKIKERSPHITLIMGGPQCSEPNFIKPDLIDYYFVGESEKNILAFLDDWENGIKPKNPKIGQLYSKFRINIDSLPYPDYSDFNLSMYTSHRAACTELSRGCVARCNYCSEVWYWKYRDRDAVAVVNELENQVKEYGINFFFFVDSLVNGNIKGLRSFAQELVDRNLDIKWWGYARIDGRMDLELLQLLVKSGCQGLNFGIESGSDRVLKAINKGNTVAEVNQNIKDCKAVGIKSSVCLVIGAPGEYIEDHNQSLTMIWNHRKRMLAISPGPGLATNHGSAYDDRKRFNINEKGDSWLGGWWSLDLMNTRIHRLIRVKTMHILLDLAKDNDGTLFNAHESGNTKDHYTIKYNENTIFEDLEYEPDFNFNIIKSGLGTFADSLMNEIFALLRLIWRARGSYEIKVYFSPDIDNDDFGSVINPLGQNFVCNIDFKIDPAGNYTVNNYYNFENYKEKHLDKNFEYTYKATGNWER